MVVFTPDASPCGAVRCIVRYVASFLPHSARRCSAPHRIRCERTQYTSTSRCKDLFKPNETAFFCHAKAVTTILIDGIIISSCLLWCESGIWRRSVRRSTDAAYYRSTFIAWPRRPRSRPASGASTSCWQSSTTKVSRREPAGHATCALVARQSRASNLRPNGRGFDPRPPHCQSVGTKMGDRFRASIPSRYCNKALRLTQPSTLCGTGNA